uniref:UDP-N-acetylglucosamine 4-epimerase n=1 Tax=Oryctolagus cuniculus TaxID=9986 RepID=A0A5F9CN57_RABIT
MHRGRRGTWPPRTWSTCWRAWAFTRCAQGARLPTKGGPLRDCPYRASAMAEEVLVTGGAGYIGSHTVLELLEAGYSPVVIDNFHNAIRGGGAMPESLRRVQELTGRKVEFEEMDILDQAALQRLFQKHSFVAVIHFAGLKAVGESVQKPLDYYRVNLTGTIQLLEIMRTHGVKNLVFSSSATVYGNPQYLPLDEAHPTGGCTNPYGKSKFFIEEMIQDLCRADKAWNAVLLRYFNPTGAHASGCIGEDPQGIPNNLMPYVSQVAIGRREALNVFGNDYDTEDGTGVRDYIHVVDLAKGHIAALKKLKEQCGCRIYNLGTGTGYSVLQMVQAMEKASGKKIPYKVVARREGDVAVCYANPSLAHEELGWTAALGLDRMCECWPSPGSVGGWTGRMGSGLPAGLGALTTRLTLPQVKIYGAGRSKILRALAHRPEDPPPLHGPDRRMRSSRPALQPLAGSQAPERLGPSQGLPYLKPQLGRLSPPGRRPWAPLTRSRASLHSIFHRVQQLPGPARAGREALGPNAASPQALIYTATKELSEVLKINVSYTGQPADGHSPRPWTEPARPES